MAIGVTFSVRVIAALRDHPAQGIDDILLHRGIGVLINSQPRGGMRTKQNTKTVPDLAFANRFLDLGGQVNQFRASICLYVYLFHFCF
jgi:hypothetical protein